MTADDAGSGLWGLDVTYRLIDARERATVLTARPERAPAFLAVHRGRARCTDPAGGPTVSIEAGRTAELPAGFRYEVVADGCVLEYVAHPLDGDVQVVSHGAVA